MAKLNAQKSTLPAGGGAFRLEQTTIGIFLGDQPEHRLSLGTDRSERIPLSAQQGWILPSGAEGLCEFDRPLDFLTVSVSDGVLSDLGLRDAASLSPKIGALDPLLVSMALQADQFGAGGTLYRETMERALAAQLVQTVAPPAPQVVGIDDARLARVVEFIQAHLAEDLSIDALAAEAAMSPTHFAKSFKTATGKSPLQYVIAERLTLAGVLLKTTTLPVAEIAYRVGYGDLSRFGQHFKRQHGLSPAAYRAE